MKEFAGFWLRFVAYLIDSVVIQVVQSFIILPVLAMLGVTIFAAGSNFDFDQLNEMETMAMIASVIATVGSIILLSVTIQILYYALMESSRYQATLGKMALGLQVTDMDGNRIDFWRAFLRQIGKILSAMFFMIGYILAGLTAKKQALHDLIADTLVIRK